MRDPDDFTHHAQARKYEVWLEGFAATGEHGRARFVTSTYAYSFAEACDAAVEALGDDSHYNRERLTYWGCRFFEDEAGARRAFG